MSSRRPPDGSLSLEWVFGYNGHTARNNVKVTRDGHLVYYVAGKYKFIKLFSYN